MEMIKQGNVIALFGIGLVICLWIFMLVSISKAGKAAKADKGAAFQTNVVSINTEHNADIIAAITAAINEYRKT